MKVGVLASGSGTNLQALIDAATRGEMGPARVVVVGANVPGCVALERAAQAGIHTFVRSHKDFATREEFDHALLDELRRHGVGVVALAGFMRIVTPVLLDAFPHRVVNIHPALLPSFPGVHAQEQAFDYGVRFSGCTVHFVDNQYDHGPVILQKAVPVLEDDTPDTLAARVFQAECAAYPEAIQWIADSRVRVEGRRVRISPPP